MAVEIHRRIILSINNQAEGGWSGLHCPSGGVGKKRSTEPSPLIVLIDRQSTDEHGRHCRVSGQSLRFFGRTRVQNFLSTINFLVSAIALAGFKPLGQVFVQFMIVWQR